MQTSRAYSTLAAALQMTSEEIFEIVDERGAVIGRAPRSRCHADPSLIHQAVHVLVFNRAGWLFLQKRSTGKDVAPGLWDTSVGGHMKPGERPDEAARREMQEELGKPPDALQFGYEYFWRSRIETELIRVFTTIDEGPFRLDPEELDDGRFWSFEEIEHHLSSGIFTPQFEHEFPRMKAWHERTI